MSRPPIMGGTSAAPGTNPEQLFAAGYAAYFTVSLRLVAAQQGLALPTDPGVSLGLEPGGRYNLAVRVTGTITGMDPVDLRQLMNAAHAVCPYANATQGNIEVTLAAG